MDIETQIQVIDSQIDAAKQFVNLASALERLKANPDFRLLITQGYLQDEAVRLVHAKGDPNMQSPQSQASIIKDIDAIGSLHSYLNTVFQRGASSTKAILADEEMREELIHELQGVA